MHHYILAVLFVLKLGTAAAQDIEKTMLRLPDTGVTSGYTPTLGEDNDYMIYPPFFIVNANGTVLDTVTGLLWQQTDGGEMTYEKAVLYCDTLTLGGYSDWRLPNAQEAFSILNHQYNNPALDAAVFSLTAAEYWWTSEPQANDSNKIWVTNAGGGIGNHLKTETVSAGGTKRIHVRAVRTPAQPTIFAQQFTDNGNGTITDQLTQLVWQQISLMDSITWEEALQYAENFSFAGYSDWRLPNIKELQSINDESRINPSINISFLPNIGINRYWSSTTLPNQTAKAWYLDTHYGITTYQNKMARLHVLLVRGDGTLVTDVTAANSQNQPTAYPNPFSSFLHLRGHLPMDTYTLYNNIGQELYSGRVLEEQNFSYLPNGIYILKIAGHATTFLRLIKQ